MNNHKQYKFSEENMKALRELGAVLREIHMEYYAKGYIIKDGKLIPRKAYVKK